MMDKIWNNHDNETSTIPFQNISELLKIELEDLKKVRTRGIMLGLTLQSASKSHMSVGSPRAKGQAVPWERCAPSLRVQLTAEPNCCNDSDGTLL